MSLPSRSVVRFYNKRGTAEQWIKEGKQATHWTRLSCHRFRANEVRLQLSVPAYNLGNLWRRLGLPNRIKSWSLTSLQHRLMKTGGRLVKHARYYWLLPAEGHLNRRLFGDMLHRIWALPLPKRVALTGRGSTVFGSQRFRKGSVGRSAVQPAQSTFVSGWTSPGAYRRRSCAGFSAKRRGIRGSAGVYFHRARAKMEILD